MSALSGYDSEAVGFESIAPERKPGSETSTQTCEFGESGVGSQTVLSKDIGCTADPEDLEDDIFKEYPPPGLNDFLRKVVPTMMEQLDQNDKEMLYNSSDSEDEEAIIAKVSQELKLEGHGLGAGDHRSSILSCTWSSAGNSLAISIGETQHETWCQNPGLIKVYTLKRSEGDKLVHTLDISEKNCVTVLKFHPAVAALLAYGTVTGEVVLYSLMTNRPCHDEGLTSPSGCHGSRRVSALLWADAHLANTFLTMQINSKGKRRGASDQILVSAGSDGTLNVWQVNANLKIFENVICYTLNANRKPAPDITCFDFIKRYCLRSFDEKVAEDIFVVGTKSGKLFLCKIRGCEEGVLDPVHEELEGHSTCVLDVAFCFQKPGVFVSVSMDSELRLYNVAQTCPLKVFCLDVAVSCMAWLGSSACVVLGLAAGKEAVRVYNAANGRAVPIEGFHGESSVTCVAVTQSGSYRVVVGHEDGKLQVWEIPARRARFTADEDF
ncbi:dynein axonemal intermediate chain 1-like [Battus philenor]|uniref:dynein axonemal intermediate chain 1-like n=1 Tax=Battus philenor TaxID=42288 RepID=UPI0035CEA97F